MRFSWCTDFATDWFETCIQDDKKKTYSPENLSYPLKNKWDWKTTYFPFRSWPLLGGHSLVFFGGVVSKSLRTLPSLDIYVPIHWWFHHLSRVDAPLHPTAWLGTSLLCLGEFFEPRNLVATKIRFFFGKNPSGLGLSQPIWESGIILQKDLRDPNAVWACRLKKATSKCR